METVTIGCRLPNGYVLEVGMQTTVRGGPQGRPVTQVARQENYARYTLRGTGRNLMQAGIMLPAQLHPRPFINQGVPKALWEQWQKEHAKSYLVTSGAIFEVKDGKNLDNVQAAVVDSMAKPAILAPVDPTKPLKVGVDKVETAKFDDDK